MIFVSVGFQVMWESKEMKEADRSAKRGLGYEEQHCLLPPSDFKPVVRNTHSLWQKDWVENPGQKL